jgi:hypothetical protein
MKILLESKSMEEGYFKPAFGNENLHETNKTIGLE